MGGSGVGLNPGGGSRGASLGGLGMRAMFSLSGYSHSSALLHAVASIVRGQINKPAESYHRDPGGEQVKLRALTACIATASQPA